MAVLVSILMRSAKEDALLARLVVRDVQRLESMAKVDGARAYLRKPVPEPAKITPNQNFLQKTLRNVAYRNQKTEEDMLWKARAKQLEREQYATQEALKQLRVVSTVHGTFQKGSYESVSLPQSRFHEVSATIFPSPTRFQRLVTTPPERTRNMEYVTRSISITDELKQILVKDSAYVSPRLQRCVSEILPLFDRLKAFQSSWGSNTVNAVKNLHEALESTHSLLASTQDQENTDALVKLMSAIRHLWRCQIEMCLAVQLQEVLEKTTCCPSMSSVMASGKFLNPATYSVNTPAVPSPAHQ